tara:strand:- start:148 stop:414 length:267 start_codon:yes stop_codon:yes gene_type:complete
LRDAGQRARVEWFSPLGNEIGRAEEVCRTALQKWGAAKRSCMAAAAQYRCEKLGRSKKIAAQMAAEKWGAAKKSCGDDRCENGRTALR